MKKITTLCLSLLIAIAVTAEDWTLVTDASLLQAGDQIVLAYADKTNNVYVTASSSIKKTTSVAYLEAVASAFTADLLQITELGETTAVLTLAGEPGAWKLGIEGASGTFYLGAEALKKLSWTASANTWTISIDADGAASIVSTTSDFGQIQYNYNSGSPRICNYKGTMKNVSIYRIGATPRFSLSYKGYPYKRTMCDLPTYFAGAQVKLTSSVPTRENDEFLGWKYKGVLYEPGATFTMPENNVVLVPYWKNSGTGVENVVTAPKAVKEIRDGQLVIIRDGVEYNVLGERIK